MEGGIGLGWRLVWRLRFGSESEDRVAAEDGMRLASVVVGGSVTVDVRFTTTTSVTVRSREFGVSPVSALAFAVLEARTGTTIEVTVVSMVRTTVTVWRGRGRGGFASGGEGGGGRLV